MKRVIKQVNNYSLITEKEKGKNYKVYESIDDLSGNKCIIRSYRIDKFEINEDQDIFIKEMKFLKTLYNENLQRVIGIEKTVNNIYLIMENCNGGTLKTYLNYYKKKYKASLPENKIIFLIKQVINALRYMSNKEILFRDLTLDNILINFNIRNDSIYNPKELYEKYSIFDSTIKIGDLGFYKDQKHYWNYSTICGKLRNEINEINSKNIEEEKELLYNSRVDLFSLGAICYELLVGICALSYKNKKPKIIKMQKVNCPDNLVTSLEAISFINGLLQFYPSKRSKWVEIINHPFITNDTDSFNKVILENVQNNKNYHKIFFEDKQNYLWIKFKTESYERLDLIGNNIAFNLEDNIITKEKAFSIDEQNKENLENANSIKNTLLEIKESPILIEDLNNIPNYEVKNDTFQITNTELENNSTIQQIVDVNDSKERNIYISEQKIDSSPMISTVEDFWEIIDKNNNNFIYVNNNDEKFEIFQDYFI